MWELALKSWPFGASWCCAVGSWRWLWDEQNTAAWGKVYWCGCSTVLARLCSVGGQLYTVLGAWILLSMQSIWDFRLLYHPRPELDCLDASRPVDPPVHLSKGTVLGFAKFHFQNGSGSFSLWTASCSWVTPSSSSSLPTNSSISRSLLFPSLQQQNTLILTKCFKITKSWGGGMNNRRDWIFTESRLPNNCLLHSLIIFKLFQIAASNKHY